MQGDHPSSGRNSGDRIRQESGTPILHLHVGQDITQSGAVILHVGGEICTYLRNPVRHVRGEALLSNGDVDMEAFRRICRRIGDATLSTNQLLVVTF
jgi:hypothetical protein